MTVHSRPTLRRRLLLALAGAGAGIALPARLAAAQPDRAFYDVRAARFVSDAAFVERLVAARFRLLGEVHDNPAHHTLRARLVTAIAAGGRHPGIAFEQLDLEHAAALQAAQATATEADGIATAGKLDRPSWRWPLHRPVFDAALAAGLPIRPANLSRGALQVALRSGDTAADLPAWRVRLDATAWLPAQEAAMAETIEDGHCGKLPPSALPRIALAQRMRDAAMAQALVDAATADGAILIAGNGHVRNDIGVPAYLGREGDRVSLGILEAPAGERNAKGFPANDPARLAGFDFVAFTEVTERTDPCLTIPDPPKTR